MLQFVSAKQQKEEIEYRDNAGFGAIVDSGEVEEPDETLIKFFETVE